MEHKLLLYYLRNTSGQNLAQQSVRPNYHGDAAASSSHGRQVQQTGRVQPEPSLSLHVTSKRGWLPFTLSNRKPDVHIVQMPTLQQSVVVRQLPKH